MASASNMSKHISATFAVMRWTTDNNRLSVHSLKDIVEPKKPVDSYQIADVGLAKYRGYPGLWKFRILGVGGTKQQSHGTQAIPPRKHFVKSGLKPNPNKQPNNAVNSEGSGSQAAVVRSPSGYTKDGTSHKMQNQLHSIWEKTAEESETREKSNMVPLTGKTSLKTGDLNKRPAGVHNRGRGSKKRQTGAQQGADEEGKKKRKDKQIADIVIEPSDSDSDVGETSRLTCRSCKVLNEKIASLEQQIQQIQQINQAERPASDSRKPKAGMVPPDIAKEANVSFKKDGRSKKRTLSKLLMTSAAMHEGGGAWGCTQKKITLNGKKC